jgi:hypothetical protein
VASFDKAIPPGQEGKVTLKINTKGKKGKLSQSAIIDSNDPQNPKTAISISGLIKLYFLIDPSFQVILQGYHGDKITKEVTITSLVGQPFEITDIKTDIKDKIIYKLKTIQKDEKYRLKIKTRSGIKEPFHGKIVLKTNSQKQPEIELFVTGMLQKEVSVSPEFLYFGIINTSKEIIDQKSLERTVIINNIKGDALTIEKIEPSSNWISTKTEANGKKQYSVVITLDKDKLPKGKFREKVTIHTKNNKNFEPAIVIIEGNVI